MRSAPSPTQHGGAASAVQFCVGSSDCSLLLNIAHGTFFRLALALIVAFELARRLRLTPVKSSWTC